MLWIARARGGFLGTTGWAVESLLALVVLHINSIMVAVSGGKRRFINQTWRTGCWKVSKQDTSTCRWLQHGLLIDVEGYIQTRIDEHCYLILRSNRYSATPALTTIDINTTTVLLIPPQTSWAPLRALATRRHLFSTQQRPGLFHKLERVEPLIYRYSCSVFSFNAVRQATQNNLKITTLIMKQFVNTSI